jgi:hypothetical protein
MRAYIGHELGFGGGMYGYGGAGMMGPIAGSAVGEPFIVPPSSAESKGFGMGGMYVEPYSPAESEADDGEGGGQFSSDEEMVHHLLGRAGHDMAGLSEGSSAPSSVLQPHASEGAGEADAHLVAGGLHPMPYGSEDASMASFPRSDGFSGDGGYEVPGRGMWMDEDDSEGEAGMASWAVGARDDSDDDASLRRRGHGAGGGGEEL